MPVSRRWRWGSCWTTSCSITAGALDGSSGLILSVIMCRAMNRSFTNVLFGAFGQVQAGAAATEAKAVKSGTAQDAADPARQRRQGRHRAGLRHGGLAGAAPRARNLRPAHQEGGGREVRDPSRRRPHAGAHERPARGGRGPVRRADRDGRHQPRPAADRRRARHRRQRRRRTRRRDTIRRARSTACRSSTPTARSS